MNLSEIEKRWSKATEGPWVVETEQAEFEEIWPFAIAVAGATRRVLSDSTFSGIDGMADADFIAHSWQDIKDLIERVKELEG